MRLEIAALRAENAALKKEITQLRTKQREEPPPKRRAPNPPNGKGHLSPESLSEERLQGIERVLAEQRLEYTQTVQSILSAQAEMQARFENITRQMLTSVRDLAAQRIPQNVPINGITDEGL